MATKFFKKLTNQASQVALVVKNPPANAGDLRDVGLTPGLGRSLGVGNGKPLQDPCLEILWTEKPGRLQFMGLQESDTTLVAKPPRITSKITGKRIDHSVNGMVL